jgi:hypothetical protein
MCLNMVRDVRHYQVVATMKKNNKRSVGCVAFFRGRPRVHIVLVLTYDIMRYLLFAPLRSHLDFRSTSFGPDEGPHSP